jgi:hypothetical protein
MRMLIVILLSLFVCTQGCAQTDSIEHNKGKNMKRYFDIKTFNEFHGRSGHHEYKTYNMSITQRADYDSNRQLIGYIEVCEELRRPYRYYYEYDTKGNLRHMSVSFCGFHIGNEYYYDSLGQITETIDYSAPYKFKLNDLIEKMKKEYGCDILDKERTSEVCRSDGKRDLKKPWYSVYYLETENRMFGDEYLIDGTTSEILYILKHLPIDEWWDQETYWNAKMKGLPMSIVEKYLYDLKKKKEEQGKKGTKKNGKSFWRKFFD